MTAAVELFTYADAHHVRVIRDNEGEPWFVLADLCRVLGLGTPARVRERLDEGVTQTHTLQTAGGPQAMTIVSESGMYEVVIRSDKPEAVNFRRWITGEVLPSIRRTGSYSTSATFDPASLTRAEILTMALNAENERLALETENKALAPKAEAYDSFLDATGKYAVGAVAQMLGTSQNKLFRELRNRHVFIAAGSRRNTPYQQYAHHFEVIPHEFERSNGEVGCSYTTYVQPSGIDFIRRKLGLPTIDPLPMGEGQASA